MKIILDPSLERVIPRVAALDPRFLANRLAPKLNERPDTSYKFLHATLHEDTEWLHQGFLGLVSYAYSNHEKLRIGPHDLWFIVMTELAKYVNNNSEQCRPLFTSAAGKTDIVVQTDDITEIDPVKIIEALGAHVPPQSLAAFMPKLSTASPEANVAMCAAFADAVQTYYSYMTFLCGIPEIEVTGTEQDWRSCNNSIDQLLELFSSVGADPVKKYLNSVNFIFSKIYVQVSETDAIDHKFWRGIFTSRNVGSGGELNISGWITRLFMRQPEVPKLENFVSTYASFPYKNLETGREFKATYGAFSQVRTPDGFIEAGYGSFVFEHLKE